jgi:exodeoxyribonuclease VII large subunit
VSGSERNVVSVADLCRKLKRTLEGATGTDWIRGEVGAVRQVASGHVYFNLKDEQEEAAVDCVAYRFHAQKIRRYLADGARVMVLGRATFWAPRGRTQLVVEVVRPAGRGELLERLMALKDALAKEGLFELARKRPLPAAPGCVGVVTSVDGAAWHDIRTIALRRGSPKLVLSAAVVQGEAAPASLLEAIDRVERYPGIEVLIVGRGGGSFEDLLAFSDERVVRRLSQCRVPVVSAVGHEIDTSLCDLVADVRAATPSEAAELVIADRSQQLRELQRLTQALLRAQQSRLDDDRAILARMRGRLSDPRFVIADKQQLLDELRVRIERTIRRQLRECRAVGHRLQRRLVTRHPQVVIGSTRKRVVALEARAQRLMQQRLARARQRQLREESRLAALSPLSVLARGYAIVLADDGRAVRHHGQAAPGSHLTIRLHQGTLEAEVTDSCHSEEQGLERSES